MPDTPESPRLPDQGSERPSGLGSLAQAARGKQLNQARGILLAIGILTIIVNAIQIGMARSEVHKALEAEAQNIRAKGMVVDQQVLAQIEEHALFIAYAIIGGAMAIGVLFVIFALIVKQFPVPITILSLILYLGGTAVFAFLDPENLGRGIIFKIIIIVGLIKAIQSAIAYQREHNLEYGKEAGL